MKKVYIYPRVAMGFQGATTGLNFEAFTLKRRSTVFKRNLQKKLDEHQLPYQAEVNYGFESPEELLQDDGVIVLISPYITSYLVADYSNEGIFVLTEDEFNSESFDRVIERVKAL